MMTLNKVEAIAFGASGRKNIIKTPPRKRPTLVFPITVLMLGESLLSMQIDEMKQYSYYY